MGVEGNTKDRDQYDLSEGRDLVQWILQRLPLLQIRGNKTFRGCPRTVLDDVTSYSAPSLLKESVGVSLFGNSIQPLSNGS